MNSIAGCPDIDHILRLAALGDNFEAASACLQVMLKKLLGSSVEPKHLWNFSSLGRTGFPVEVAFVSDDPSLRITAEVTGPEIPPSERLNYAEELFSELNGSEIPPVLSRFVHSIQKEGSLRYGAWLGSRHSCDGNSFKLYMEVPCYPDNSPEVKAWEQAIISRPFTRPARLRMIGYNGDSHTLELYYDTTYVWPQDLPALMSPVGLRDYAGDVTDYLFQAYRRPVNWELPGASDYGFSYAVPCPYTNNNKSNSAFSLYTFANALFGGDHSIRAAILELSKRQGWDSSLYEEISRPIAHKRGFITHHGVFGIVMSSRGRASVTFGLTLP
ncbi:hypothetical protein LY28_00256 [Ruminiclostridium sufflavum DSM 19573]|uniref:Uncharacterized protein n=1 Tax=Ruminiclostridium sufflavum DSM 19573 TaxID=1121337 RepID=A0A318XU51_9FIRM|nr:hypothetical protein [Ruminiclostridium sufflavum]PYG90373.1 hypothetical protein LY28_00256 [Ruminiclostridium sufflavum DSM 19573]